MPKMTRDIGGTNKKASESARFLKGGTRLSSCTYTIADALQS